MSKHAIRNADGAQALNRLFQAGPYRTLVAVALATLVVAAVAIPRYRAVIGGTSTGTVHGPAVNVPAPQPVTAPPAEPPLPVTNATPVEREPVSDSSSSTPVKAPRVASEKKVSEGRVTRKWNGDWQAATAHLGSDRLAAGSTTGSTPPAATVSLAADGASARAETTSATSVTMTGCLEMSVDNEEFRLTETEGANVPKARSWRSGFLRKQTAPVALLELADPATARKYVGQRVVVTGLVENREMRVRSLQTSSKGCD